MKWFRFHADALNNPKVQRLHPEVFRAWVNILCIACEHNGAIPDIPDLAFLLRTDEQETRKAVAVLVSARLLEKRADGYTPHDWDEHQYRKASDDPARVKERVTRYRALRNAGVTRPDTDTDTDTEAETEQKKPPVAIATSPKGGKRATALDPDFTLDADMIGDAHHVGVVNPEREFDKFRDYHLAKGDTMKDWRAAWRTWCRNSLTFSRGSPNGQYKNSQEKTQDAIARYYERITADETAEEDESRPAIRAQLTDRSVPLDDGRPRNGGMGPLPRGH